MSVTVRPTVITGNWKMYKTISEAVSFIEGLIPFASKTHAEVGLAVPFTILPSAAKAAQNSLIKVGAQNLNAEKEGAFTGEISGRMLTDAGASFVIVGHSERRRLFHETDAMINKKLKGALHAGLRTIVCIGETLEEHQQGKVQTVLQKQIEQSFEGITEEQLKNVILAYEPVWAIGTNQTATPEIAQKAHRFCREVMARKWGEIPAEKVVIQYGGSVKADNAASLLEQADVDGLLVGGASLSLDSFSKIIRL
jgi:triosephosphate isomerase (TIM)